MSVIKAVGATMFIVSSLIISYFLFSPFYYTMLDEVNSALLDNDPGSEAQSFSSFAYGTFFYGLSTLVVLGILAAIYWLYMYVRRRYYATEAY